MRIPKRCVLMRHADAWTEGPHEVIGGAGLEGLINAVNIFKDEIFDGYDAVVILHSPVERASVTAVVFGRRLEEAGIQVLETRPIGWLEMNTGEITDERLLTELPGDESVLAVFISHYGQISRYLQWETGTRRKMANCALYWNHSERPAQTS